MTLTVTEKGYSRRPDTGGLDTAAPGVAADLAATADADAGTWSRSSAGWPRRSRRASGPAGRRSTSCPATTPPRNGAALAGVVRGFVEASAWPDRRRRRSTGWAPRSASRTRSSTASSRPPPPRTATPRRRARPARRDGRSSASRTGSGCCRTPSSRPARRGSSTGRWSSRTSRPYQLMKLRLLNGSHSAHGLPRGGRGLPDGRRGAGDRVGRAAGAQLRRRGRADPARPRGPDAATYVDDLVERFRNPAMHHLLRQIGSDGSLKIPERWLDRAAGAAGGRGRHTGAGAGRWPAGSTPPGPTAPVQQVFGTTDPAAAALARCWQDTSDPSDAGRRPAARGRRRGSGRAARPHRVGRRPTPGPAGRAGRDLSPPLQHVRPGSSCPCGDR